MAVSHVLKQADGNPIRSAMSVVDMDGNASFLIGTTIGITVGTKDAAGVDVHVANEQEFTSVVAMTGHELMQALADKISNVATGGVAGAKAWYAENSDNDFVLHVLALKSADFPAQSVLVSLPTFVPGT